MKAIERKVVGCVCGCTVVEFVNFPDDDYICLEVYENAFYSKHESMLKNYLKRLWKAICGKEYSLFDIVILPENAKEISQVLAEWTEAE